MTSIATRGMMIVLNNTLKDNRVLKMAQSMRRVYPEFTLVSTYESHKFNQKPKETTINGLRCVLFPNYAKAVTYEKNYSEQQLALMRHRRGIKHLTEDIAAFAAEFKPLCLHTHDMYSLPIGDKVKRDANKSKRSLTWIHDVHEFLDDSTDMPPLLRKYAIGLEEKYVENADEVLTATDTMGKNLTAKYAGIKSLNVVLDTPNLYTTNSDNLSDVRRDCNLSDGKKIIVYTGQVKENRGAKNVVETLPYLPDAHYVVLTNDKGGLIDAMNERALELGVSDRLHFLPRVKEFDVASYIETADLGIILNNNEDGAEGALSAELFDYAFASIPTVAQRSAAMQVFFKSYKVGRLTDFEKPKAAAAAIEFWLNKEPIQFQKHCTRIEKTYSWEVQESKLIETYMKVRGFNNFKVLNEVEPPAVPKQKLRVLQGVTGAAGQPNTLSKSLNKLPGIYAASMQVSLSKFGYPADLFYPVKKADFGTMAKALNCVADSFDVFHLHARGFLFDRFETAFPTGSDLLALKATGKQVIVHFRGSEARLQSEFVRRNPFNYVEDDKESTVKKFPEPAKRKYINLVSQICDLVLVNDPEIQSYVPGSTIIERAIDLSSWKNIGIKKTKLPLVVHAPSKRGVKGTDYVIAAVESLKAQGLKFDFKLVEGLKHDEARAIYEKADIIVDQLRIGWYGVLAVEAMALGKPVIAYIREDLLHTLGDKPPVINANPLTIESALSDLITDYDYRKAMSVRAREFCEQTHSADVVAKKLRKIYKDIHANPRPINTRAVLGHLVNQQQASQDKYIKQVKERAAYQKAYKNEVKERSVYQKAYKKSKSRLNAKTASLEEIDNSLKALQHNQEKEIKQIEQSYSATIEGLQTERQKLEESHMTSRSFGQRMEFVKRKYSSTGFFSATKYFSLRLFGINLDNR